MAMSALDRLILEGLTMIDITEHLAALRKAAITTRPEWTSELHYTNGDARHGDPTNKQHAELIVDSIALHLTTDRAPQDVAKVVLVRRNVFTLPDGTQVVEGWRYVRDGEPLTFDDEG